jgi:hypothetical protein
MSKDLNEFPDLASTLSPFLIVCDAFITDSRGLFSSVVLCVRCITLTNSYTSSHSLSPLRKTETNLETNIITSHMT